MNPPDLKTQFLQELGRFRPLAGADLAWSAEPGSLEWPADHPAPDYVVDARLLDTTDLGIEAAIAEAAAFVQSRFPPVGA